MNARTRRANEMATLASGLVWLMGAVDPLPSAATARGWQQDSPAGLRALAWTEANAARTERLDVWSAGRKVLSVAVDTGSDKLDVITFRRGAWEQELCDVAAFIGTNIMEIMSPASWGVPASKLH